MADADAALFTACGLDKVKVDETLRNPKLTQTLKETIADAKISSCDKVVGKCIYNVATKLPANALCHRPALLAYVLDGRIKTDPQVMGAMEYLGKVGVEAIDTAAFEAASGVGQNVTEAQLKEAVAEVMKTNHDLIVEQRYRVNVGTLLGGVRVKYPWGDMKLAKAELDNAIIALLGPKTDADNVKPQKKKAPKEPKAAPAAAAAAAAAAPPTAEADPFKIFPKPCDNNQVHTDIYFSDGTIWRPMNSPEKLKKHLAVTGGKVWTRFPPEPNGYLHIGHAKAMHVDFGFAQEYGGVCYLRYDDTNPEAEKLEYIEHIQEIVKWMGWTPWKITYSSDYFQELYDMAVDLIKRGHAYCCHQTKAEIEKSREARQDSPWRDRPVAENLRIFDEMRRGMWDEGSVTLRMKMDTKNENFNMHDLIAYRIKFTPHPHAGDKWVVYPSYDYTHCIVDALENITHSLCTLEFESRRASYYWLLEALDTYLPHVWEYARLNITSTVLSKRKLNCLVTDHHVLGWDDPRLLTLAGLRRRGAPPGAINAFCREVGITRNENTINMKLLEFHIRDHLNKHAPRTMLVLDPLKLVITNLPPDTCEQVEGAPPIGPPYKVTFSKIVYIEKSDYRDEDSKDYYGLAPGKTVMLRYAYPIKCTEVVRGKNGVVTELRCEYDPQRSTKPKGVIHWIGQPSPGVDPISCEVRLFDRLFKSDDPQSLGDKWLEDVNQESLKIVQGAMMLPHMLDAPQWESYQCERVGYFCMDNESTAKKPILNRTVSLKEQAFVKSVKSAA